MLLSERARASVSRTMRIGCFLKIYPYRWDPVNYRVLPATRIHMVIFRIHELFICWTAGFMLFRFLQTINEDIPSRIRIMNFIWVLAYGLVLVVNAEFEVKRDEVMDFINALCGVMERERREQLELKKKLRTRKIAALPPPKKKGYDWTSLIVLVSSALLFTNPPAHATVLFSSPCAPQYITSLIFQCKSYVDIPTTFFEILPFVLLENVFITDMMFCGTFGWTFVFLGLTWIKEKMDIGEGMSIDNWIPAGARGKMKNPGKIYKFATAPENYRQAQLITMLLNDSFKLYLQWYPNILFSILGMLIFGTIRYSHIDLHSYSVFPFCSLRCIFDAVSVLAVAGNVNASSDYYLEQWDKEIETIPLWTKRKYIFKFHKSCWQLTCSAGGLYTFENSIVLVSLDNCTQLVFNMLVTYD